MLKWIAIAALLGGLSVIFGAFAAHALKGALAAKYLSVFNTGVDYLFLHTFALIAVALLGELKPQLSARLNTVAWLFLLGIILFSGSLLLLAVTQVSWLGIITPIGGVLMITAWFLLSITIIRYKK